MEIASSSSLALRGTLIKEIKRHEINGARCAALTLVLQDCLGRKREGPEFVGEKGKGDNAYESGGREVGLRVDVKEYADCESEEDCEEVVGKELV